MGTYVIPSPIIFGQKPPQLRLKVQFGRQLLFSMSNYNLFLIAYLDFDGKPLFDEKYDRTYQISDMLEGWSDFDELYPLPGCTQPCRMLIKEFGSHRYTHEVTGEEVLTINRITLHETPLFAQCPALSAVLNECQTEAERKFATVYYRWALGGYDVLKGKTRSVKARFQKFVDYWHKEQLNLPARNRTAEAVSKAIVRSLTAPALVPQVWLNYVYDPKRRPEKAERTTLKDMPSRVDFVMIINGELHVIEIDDPSHYARFDEQMKRWDVDEERYTRNLLIERRLRKEGWFLHRFSNWEIINSSEAKLLRTILDELDLWFLPKKDPELLY